MSVLRKDDFGRRLPTQVESATADQLRQIIASQAKEGEDTHITVTSPEGKPQTIALTPALTASLMDLLRLVSGRQGFQMVPLTAELTTQQAALSDQVAGSGQNQVHHRWPSSPDQGRGPFCL